jgi:NAD+ kinase
VSAPEAILVAHHERPEAAALAAEAAAWLRGRGWRVWMPDEDVAACGLGDLAGQRPVAPALAFSLGGDGTVLRTVALAAPTDTPVLAVNVGLLGYLAEVEPEGMLDALGKIVAGDVAIEERMLLAVEVGADGVEHCALNEVVIEKRESGHTVRLAVRIDGEPFTTYAADGLIVATPTGSTAYSLSVRGPIVSPRHRALLVTPVSPHMLFDRTLVLDPSEHVEVQLLGHRPADVAVDGVRVATIAEGDVVRCREAARRARFVRVGRARFHAVLKAKFGLNDR